MSIVNGLLAASNLFALGLLRRAWMNCGVGVGEFTLICCTVASSVLMHLSDTKHDLRPGWIGKYSKSCLWMDRIFAISLCIFGAGRFLRRVKYEERIWSVQLLSQVSVGLLLSYIGEQKIGHPGYVVCHGLWHWIAYRSYEKLI